MKYALTLALILFSAQSFAQEKVELKEWMTLEADHIDEYLFNLEGTQMDLKGIQVRLRASYGVEVPLLVKAKIRPEIEFYFSK